MTTEMTFKDGKCGFKNIRVKVWNSGFSVKCLKKRKTILGRPFIEDYLRMDLLTFCDNCDEAKL
jgi:hypothetical protein